MKVKLLLLAPKPGEYDHPKIDDGVKSRFRPDTRSKEGESRRLNARFYPEGGHLVAGLRNRVALSNL